MLEQINKAVEYTVKEFGKIDILVSNAAHWKMEEFLDVQVEDYDAIMDTKSEGHVFF